jgi:repressor LexA
LPSVCRVDGVRRSLYSDGEHTFVPDVEIRRNHPVLTARQQEIWNYLVEYVDRHGYPPTVREIGEHVGLASPSTVHAHLANLERAGLLHRDPTKPRALELIGRERREPEQYDERTVAHLPLLGQIAAGGPTLAEQDIEEYLPMPASTKGDFLLRVKGESMIDAGILDGDLVIVQRAQDARNGEIVVALAGDDESTDEATVKTFYREGKQIRLQPENASLEPIYARHVQILGRVVGVFREL